MKELEQILGIWNRARAGEPAVLATVVKTRGSSYRLPGARLLLTESGKRAGSISGGCLEDNLLKKAWWLTESGPLVRRYDTTPEGEIGSGEFGLGCNGIIHVLLERLTAPESPVLELLQSVRQSRQPAVIAHVIEPAEFAGQRLILDSSGIVGENIGNPELRAFIEAESRSVLSEGVSRLVSSNEGSEVFVEAIRPPVRLLMFGAGDDAVPLSDLAKYLGWHVSVFDGRAHYARREKFPNADEVRVWSADEDLMDLAIDPWTVAVLMSHSYSQDLARLQRLASLPLRYLGILGPRKRTLQLLSDAGLELNTRASLHSPVGLDIGADGPEQVALAVVAEIQATLNGREGGLLRERAGSIHAPEADADPAQAWARSIACA